MNTEDIRSYTQRPLVDAAIHSQPAPAGVPAQGTLQIIGFRLSRIILLAIAVFIMGFLAVLAFHESNASEHMRNLSAPALSDSAFQRRLQLLQVLQEEKKSYRDFSLQMAQMILLNLLLPVLTAILGYIFASGKRAE